MASDNFSLRVYSYLDRMQPQYAAFVGTITQGDLPTEGMGSLYVEVAPGNEVFRLVDIAVKSTEAKPGHYRGLASIGAVLCLGALFCLFAALLLLPVFLAPQKASSGAS